MNLNFALTRKNVLLLLLSFVFIEEVRSQDRSIKTNDKPNIIFILTDDLGWGDLGVLYQQQRQKANHRSEPWIATPNLDKMAASGAILPHHYSPAPVCAPSRASFLLGVSQGHANVRDNQFDKALEDNYTIASALRKIGYKTAAIGKWGLQGKIKQNVDWPAHPLNRGFDYYFGYIRHADGHEHYPKEGIYRGTKQVWDNQTNITSELDKCYTGDLWTAAAKKWIIDLKNSDNKDNPFFMYLAYDTPHAVLELPTQEYPSGSGLTGGIQWLGKPGNMINTASGKVDSWIHPDYEHATYDHDRNTLTPEVSWPDVYQRYATSVRRIDYQVGDIMQLLKDLHIDENTLIVFSSDNGPSNESYLPAEFGANSPEFFNSFGPFTGIKRDVLDGGIRVPAIAYWPRHIPPGRIIDQPGILYDWFPTFADAAGMPAPARIDGVSLLPSLTGNGKQKEGLIYVEYFEPGNTPDYEVFNAQHRKRKRNQMQMLRIGDYVGLRYDIKSKDDNFEIYNVVKDPAQTNNLAKKRSFGSLQNQMKEKVLRVRRPDSTARRPYDNEFVPGIPELKVRPGLTYKWFPGDFPWIPEITTLQPQQTGIAKYPVYDAVKEKHNGILYFEGYLRIPADGTYTFFINADEGALLKLHDAVIIDADYKYIGGTERQGKIMLKAGVHPIRLYYMKKENSKALLNVMWEGPEISKQVIRTEDFCFKDLRDSSI